LKKEEGDPFEKNKTDEFKLNGLDVGEVTKINLSHDGKSMGDGWYVDTVTIVVKGLTTEFKCDRWLDVGEGDKKISVDFLANKKTGKTYFLFYESFLKHIFF
jgi:lipoxygenase homology domain-containing protein 1